MTALITLIGQAKQSLEFTGNIVLSSFVNLIHAIGHLKKVLHKIIDNLRMCS